MSKTECPENIGNSENWTRLHALGKDAWNAWADHARKNSKNVKVIKIMLGGDIPHPNFSGFSFPYPVEFIIQNPNGPIKLDRCQFDGDVSFENQKSSRSADFSGTVFCGEVTFSHSNFNSNAIFEAAEFQKKVDFERCLFGNIANFENTKFMGNARFLNCDFNSLANFRMAHFDHDCTFKSAQFKSTLNLAYSEFTSTIPNFRAASFNTRYPPDLNKMHVEYPIVSEKLSPNLGNTSKLKVTLARALKLCALSDGSERARILKRLAADGHNHDEELRFFAMEMKAKRYHEAPYNKVKSWPKLLINHAYEFLSDFGQSTLRPLLCLVGIFAVSAYCYSGLLHDSFTSRLNAIWNGNISILTASFSSLLPFAGQVLIGRKVIENGLCGQHAPKSLQYFDCLASIYRISAVEGVLAFVFLFLLGLALRNIARIK